LLLLNDKLYAPDLAARLLGRLTRQFNALLLDDVLIEWISTYEQQSRYKLQFVDREVGIQPEDMKKPKIV
jgi:hypothetical protein